MKSKSKNMYISAVSTLNQFFVKDSYTQIKFSKNWSSRWQTCILRDEFISYS